MTYITDATGSAEFPIDQLYSGRSFIAYPGEQPCASIAEPLRLCILGNSFTYHPPHSEQRCPSGDLVNIKRPLLFAQTKHPSSYSNFVGMTILREHPFGRQIAFPDHI